MGGVGATIAATREEGPDMMETATNRVAEVTAVAASATTIITAETVRGMRERTQLAEARGTKSLRVGLRPLPLAKVVVVEAASRDPNRPMAEKSRTHATDSTSMPTRTQVLSASPTASVKKKFQRVSTSSYQETKNRMMVPRDPMSGSWISSTLCAWSMGVQTSPVFCFRTTWLGLRASG